MCCGAEEAEEEADIDLYGNMRNFVAIISILRHKAMVRVTRRDRYQIKYTNEAYNAV